MKKFYLIIASLFISTVFFGQTVQGTIKPGSTATSLIVSIKPSADLTDAKISTFYFAIAIPANANPAPTVTILTNLNANIAYVIDAPSVATIDGTSYNVYDFRGDGAQAAGTEKNYTSTGDNDLIEFSIANGPADLSTVGIVSLADGGSTSNSFFNIYNKGIDVTNTSAMFYGSGAQNSADGYTGLSYKFLGVVTPVKFLSFYALKSGSDAKLTWTVENDGDNKYFDIERSTDGRTYTAFTRVNALENGKSLNTYETSDNGILSGSVVYYRIKQVDRNGTVTYSLIRDLKLDKNLTISLYPNPARNITKLVLDAPTAGKASVSIRDAAGKQVQLVSLQLVKGINQQNLNIQTLPAGEYNVTIIGEKLSQTIKLSKIN